MCDVRDDFLSHIAQIFAWIVDDQGVSFGWLPNAESSKSLKKFILSLTFRDFEADRAFCTEDSASCDKEREGRWLGGGLKEHAH